MESEVIAEPVAADALAAMRKVEDEAEALVAHARAEAKELLERARREAEERRSREHALMQREMELRRQELLNGVLRKTEAVKAEAEAEKASYAAEVRRITPQLVEEIVALVVG
ncbi:MAG: hypothetical protein BWY06_03087 [Candidatus Latescibacteria bacterium ADurb.Bin168]|nr:MAG: hypothetical protein BWY06_03087 [Candidatus Latescibacteria bacterium ADurb.Bin168]